LPAERDHINQELQRVIDEQVSAWGVKVTSFGMRMNRAASVDEAGNGAAGYSEGMVCAVPVELS
jgi:hypothetical protein